MTHEKIQLPALPDSSILIILVTFPNYSMFKHVHVIILSAAWSQTTCDFNFVLQNWLRDQLKNTNKELNRNANFTSGSRGPLRLSQLRDMYIQLYIYKLKLSDTFQVKLRARLLN